MYATVLCLLNSIHCGDKYVVVTYGFSIDNGEGISTTIYNNLANELLGLAHFIFCYTFIILNNAIMIMHLVNNLRVNFTNG